MRFGVCTGPENLPALIQAGYDYLEPSVAGTLQPERPDTDVMPPLRAAIEAAPLKAEAYNVLLSGDLKVVGRGIDAARQERYLESAFGRAAALGGQVVVFGSGGARRIPDGFPPDQARTQIEEFIRRCGDAAARNGLTVAIEPLNRAECNHIVSVVEAMALARAAGHPAVGVLSDLYHITQEGQSYEETRAAAPLLAHVHVAGAEGRRAPVADDFDFLAPYFRVLKEIGYDRRISIEANWEDLTAQAAQALGVLRRAWEAA